MPEEEKVINIDINLLTPNPYQPRKVFNEQTIKELAESIKEYGILNPILIRKNNNKYEIIAGERRYRAAKSIGLTTIPAIVKNISDEQTAKIALIENIQRENLSPVEEAKAYKQILDITKITQSDLATLLGKSQSSIANKIRLLSLPDDVQEALKNKKISERHARSLMTVGNKNYQLELLSKIIEQKLTVKELDDIIKKEKNTKEEIKMTISDVMQSLKEKEIKMKEEKESDNMNNGNFFPNYNNQMNPNNNATLNSLNAQSINGNPLPATNEMVMPSINNIPENNNTPVMNQPMPQNIAEQMASPQMPTTDISQPKPEEYQPLFNNFSINPIPDFNINNPVNNVEEIHQEVPSVIQNNQLESPIINPIQEPIVQNNDSRMDTQLMNNTQVNDNNQTLETSTTPQFLNNGLLDSQNIIQETPIFSIPNVETTNDSNIESMPTSNQNFEVPISDQKDNLTKTTEFLNQNNITYKLYSNDNGHCIIIELS